MLNGQDGDFKHKMNLRKTKDSIKILTIGNSFSEDSVEHLYELAKDCGAEEVKIANLVIGGCSLERHADNMRKNARAYSYQKNISGTLVKQNQYSIEDGLKDEDWDIITLQQVSGFSGIAESYNKDLDDLIDYVYANKRQDAIIAWNMTWAYNADSNHADFGKYNMDQMTMYNAITNAVIARIIPNDKISAIIPTGTAIQNLRTSFIGDDVTRDGYHLSLALGRYSAGIAWLKNLTGWDISNITFVPDISDQLQITSEQLVVIKEAAENSFINPFGITESKYKR